MRRILRLFSRYLQTAPINRTFLFLHGSKILESDAVAPTIFLYNKLIYSVLTLQSPAALQHVSKLELPGRMEKIV